jgi:hypothetical protein
MNPAGAGASVAMCLADQLLALATDQLRQLLKDKLDAKFEIRQFLEKYAEWYGIGPIAVTDLVYLER